jgi:serine/threonine protein kinase
LHILTGEKVAVKIIDKKKLSSKDFQCIQREVEILKRIMHPSLVHLHEIIETEKSLLLITEYIQNG